MDQHISIYILALTLVIPPFFLINKCLPYSPTRLLAYSPTRRLVPVAVIIMFSNLCGKRWLLLWARCSTVDTRKELDVLGPTGISKLVPGSTCNIPALSQSSLKEGAMQAMGVSVGYIDAKVLVSGADICNPSNRAWHQQYSQCGRAVVEAMAPLLIAKMALAALLLPAIRILQWRVAPAGWTAFVQGLPGRCRRRCRKKAATTDDNGGNDDAATTRRHGDNVRGHGGRE